MTMVGSITHSLNEIGIKKGDILYIPSDITTFMVDAQKLYSVRTSDDRKLFLNSFIDVLQNIVSSEGTILFPIFTWTFNRGKAFDVRNTLGEVGALPNWILKNRFDFKRTQHPMYSFLVWGKDTDILLKMNNVNCWGQYSPFGYMYRKNAKTLFFNVSIRRGFTFSHYVEEVLQVPYRYYKNFHGEYIDIDGNTTQRNYVMYVRDLDIISQEYSPDSFYEKNGIVKSSTIHNSMVKVMDCQKAFDLIKDDFLNNGGRYMYKFENYTLDWTKEHTHADEINN